MRPPRFRLIPALWTTAQRLRQRWSPLLAAALFLVASPTVLLAAIYVAQGGGWGGLAIGTAVGTVVTALSSGTVAWLALAGGDDPWKVAAEGLGRAFFKLSPLAGLVLLVTLPSILLSVGARLAPRTLFPDDIGQWVWWSVSWFGALLPAVLMAVLAPVVGILMFEGGDLRPAVAQAFRMTRGSRLKLILLQSARVLLLGMAGAAVTKAGQGWSPAAHVAVIATFDALGGTLAAMILNQAYFQLHANLD